MAKLRSEDGHQNIYTEEWAESVLQTHEYRGRGGETSKNLLGYLHGEALLEVLMALKVKAIKTNKKWRSYGYRFRQVVSPRSKVPMILVDLIPPETKHHLPIVGA